MCIELGAFLIVSTRPDDERRRLGPFWGSKQTPRDDGGARAVVFRRRRRHLFRMKESRTNSGERRNTTER